MDLDIDRNDAEVIIVKVTLNDKLLADTYSFAPDATNNEIYDFITADLITKGYTL